jgi:hypothetical protein
MTMFVSSFTTRASVIAAVSVCVVAVSSCSDSSPTAPTPTAQAPTQPGPAPAPPPTPAPAPQAVGAVQITVNPNPVPHSGAPITDAAGCAGVRNTWFYDQVFQETGGSTVTFTQRIDLFDDRETNNISNLNVVVPANGSNSIRSRWCSSTRAAHTAQTRWTGTDAAGRAISVLGPKVTLSAPQ